MTDTELKLALAKMLPEVVAEQRSIMGTHMFFYWIVEGEGVGESVRDTELDYLVRRAEAKLTDEEWDEYYRQLYLVTRPENYTPGVGCDTHTKAFISATWQQRTTALCYILNVTP